MKNLILISSVLAIFAFSFSSCKKCIKCEIIGNSIDTISLIDNIEVEYDEFCGSSSEVEAFRGDVQFSAENHMCKIYSIRKIQNAEVLGTFVNCGGSVEIKEFEYGLDTLLTTTYANLDAKWVVDTLITNPASWNCNDIQ